MYIKDIKDAINDNPRISNDDVIDEIIIIPVGSRSEEKVLTNRGHSGLSIEIYME